MTGRCTVTRVVLYGPAAVITAALASTVLFLGWLRRRELGDLR